MSEKGEYWWPELADADYFARMRKDYPEHSHLSDEELGEYFEVRGKYADTWDHAGDAYNDYEPLADDWFKLRAVLARIGEMECECVEPGDGIANNTCARCIARAALHTEGEVGGG